LLAEDIFVGFEVRENKIFYAALVFCNTNAHLSDTIKKQLGMNQMFDPGAQLQ
jgi:hypothetical protein